MTELRKSLVRYGAALVLLALVAVGPSAQDVTSSVLNQSIQVSNQEETVNIGKKETNNYHHEENNYQPTQNTHVTVNVGKVKSVDKNKMRKHRPPTAEETAMKLRILEVYDRARAEVKSNGDQRQSFLHLDHLGRILNALNPKYIATKRMWRAAFADPANPAEEVVPPERDLDEVYKREFDALAAHPLELSGAAGHPPATLQLDQLAQKFQSSINWDEPFVQELLQISDSQLTTSQLAFKQLLQCLTYPQSCNKPLVQSHNNPLPEGPEQLQTSAIERGPPRERLVRVPTPERTPARFMAQQVGQYSPTPAEQEEQEEEEEPSEFEYEQESGQLPYQPSPAEPPVPMGRRRFAPEAPRPAPGGFNPWPGHRSPDPIYPSQGYQHQEMVPPHGYQPDAMVRPQSPAFMRGGPPRRHGHDELTQRLIQKYAPDYGYESFRRLG